MDEEYVFYSMLLVPVVLKISEFITTQSFSFLFIIHIGLSIAIFKLYLKIQEEFRIKVNEEDKHWIFNKVMSLDDGLQGSIRMENELMSILELPSYNSEKELNITTQEKTQAQFSIIGRVEENLITIERNMAIFFVSLIFVPIIFIVVHLFIDISISSIMVTLLSIYYFFNAATYELRKNLTISGYAELLQLLEDNKDINYIHLYKYVTEDSDFLIELNTHGKPALDSGAKTFFYSIISVLNMVDSLTAAKLIDNILQFKDRIAMLEYVQDKKMKAFSTNYVFISISVMFFIGVLSSMTSLITTFFAEYAQEFLNFSPSPMVEYFSLVLSISLAYLYSESFSLNRKKMIGIWFVIHWLTITIVKGIFSILITSQSAA